MLISVLHFTFGQVDHEQFRRSKSRNAMNARTMWMVSMGSLLIAGLTSCADKQEPVVEKLLAIADEEKHISDD